VASSSTATALRNIHKENQQPNLKTQPHPKGRGLSPIVKYGVMRGKPAFIFKPLVNDADVWEAFGIMVSDGVVPVSGIGELMVRLSALGLVLQRRRLNHPT